MFFRNISWSIFFIALKKIHVNFFVALLRHNFEDATLSSSLGKSHLNSCHNACMELIYKSEIVRSDDRSDTQFLRNNPSQSCQDFFETTTLQWCSFLNTQLAFISSTNKENILPNVGVVKCLKHLKPNPMVLTTLKLLHACLDGWLFVTECILNTTCCLFRWLGNEIDKDRSLTSLHSLYRRLHCLGRKWWLHRIWYRSGAETLLLIYMPWYAWLEDENYGWRPSIPL